MFAESPFTPSGASATVITVCRFLGLTARRAWLWGAPLGLGVVHALVFSDLGVATGVTNLTIGAQIVWASVLLLRGAGGVRWRWLCGGAALANGLMTLARGVLVACMGVLVMAFSDLPQERAWAQSNLVPVLVPGAQWLARWLPDWAAGELDFGNGRPSGDNAGLEQTIMGRAGAAAEALGGALPAPAGGDANPPGAEAPPPSSPSNPGH